MQKHTEVNVTTIARIGIAGLVAVSLAGCAGPRAASSQDMQSRLAQLDGRVSTLERHVGLIEGKAWNQREDVSYLKGRVEGLQPSIQGATRPASVKSTPRRIQTALKNAGFYAGAVDGKIGPQTKQAIKEFQRARGLSADGRAGSKTWAQLAQYLPSESGNGYENRSIYEK